MSMERPDFHVGIIGGGVMGAGIAQTSIVSGCRVTVVEPQPSLAQALPAALDTAVRKILTKSDRAADADILGRNVSVTQDIAEISECHLVIEAIHEDLEAKHAVFTQLAGTTADEVPLCSNTSSIPISRIAASTSAADRIVGMHFFNPVPIMKLVEITPTLNTRTDVIDTARMYSSEILGKVSIITPDRPGFLVNSLFVPYVLSALRMLDNGISTKEDIDAAMVGGCNMPIGPIALADVIGLDTLLFVAESLYEELRDPACVPPSGLRRLVEAGHLGRKSGRGYYVY